MVFCNECGTQIAEESKFCLSCGSPVQKVSPPTVPPVPNVPIPTVPTPNEPKRGFFATAPGVALVVMIAVLLIAGIVTGSVLLLRDNKKETVETTQPKADANKVYTVRETAKSGDLAITVYGYKMLSDGKYLGVDVGIENKGTKTETISTKEEMSVKDPDGKSYGIASFVTESPFPEGELKAGQTARGWVVLEFPASGKAEFIFDSGTGGEVRFK